MLKEQGSRDNLVRKFIYGRGIDEPIIMIVETGVYAGTYYYHFDALGSVAALSKVNGEIQEQYTYDVFGKPNTTSSIGNPYLFTGREYDSETGNYYYRARYYSTKLGRFLSPDSIGYADSMNMYQYCLNNPVNSLDPFGLKIKIVGDEAAVQQAYNYLSKSSQFTSTWNLLEKNESETYYIYTNNERKNKFALTLAEDTGIKRVYWDPHAATENKEKRSYLWGLITTYVTTGTHSPALGLAHELEHMRGYVEMGKLDIRPTKDDYETYEEKRVIQGPETIIANEIGEPTRRSHKGQYFTVTDPTKRCKK